MQIIFESFKMKFRNNLVSKLSRLLKNLQLSRFQLGMVPIVTTVFKPWMDEQGIGCSSPPLLAAAAPSPLRLPTSAWLEQPWWSQRPSKRAKTAGRQLWGEKGFLLAATLFAYDLTLEKLRASPADLRDYFTFTNSYHNYVPV